MKNFIFLFAALAAFGLIENSAASGQTPKAADITEISLSYGGSHFAAASGFTIVLHKNGTAEFTGGRNSSREGDYIGTFDKREFVRLAKFIVAQEFFLLDNDYVKDVQDGGTTTTRVRFSGGEKTIKNNSWRKSNGDDRLPDIENAISAVDGRLLIEWKRLKK